MNLPFNEIYYPDQSFNQIQVDIHSYKTPTYFDFEFRAAAELNIKTLTLDKILTSQCLISIENYNNTIIKNCMKNIEEDTNRQIYKEYLSKIANNANKINLNYYLSPFYKKLYSLFNIEYKFNFKSETLYKNLIDLLSFYKQKGNICHKHPELFCIIPVSILSTFTRNTFFTKDYSNKDTEKYNKNIERLGHLLGDPKFSLYVSNDLDSEIILGNNSEVITSLHFIDQHFPQYVEPDKRSTLLMYKKKYAFDMVIENHDIIQLTKIKHQLINQLYKKIKNWFNKI